MKQAQLIDAYDFQPEEVQRAYDARSKIYSKTVAQLLAVCRRSNFHLKANDIN